MTVQAEVRPAKYFLRLTHERQIADLEFLVFSIFLLTEPAGKRVDLAPDLTRSLVNG
jgi:hypothetical protein